MVYTKVYCVGVAKGVSICVSNFVSGGASNDVSGGVSNDVNVSITCVNMNVTVVFVTEKICTNIGLTHLSLQVL